MAQATWSLQNAKNQFSAVVEAARKAPQTVTKHGRPAVVVLAADEYERLNTLRRLKAPGLVELLLAMPQGEIEFERLKTKARDVAF